MALTEIKISELNYLNTVNASDFFPIVNSGSLTTYRTDIYTFNEWMAASGSALSASYPPYNTGFWNVTGSNIYNINYGYVGVNTQTPQFQFDVIGDIHTNSSLVADIDITSSAISASNYIETNNLRIPYRKFNYITESPLYSSIFFNSQYGTSAQISTDWVSMFFTDPTGDAGQLNIAIGDNSITASIDSSQNYTLIGPNIEYLKQIHSGLVISTFGTSLIPIQQLPTASAFFVNTDTGFTYGRIFCGDRFMSHDFSTGIESTYGTSSIAKSYVATTASIGFVGTASAAISSSYSLSASYATFPIIPPGPAYTNFIKAFGTYDFNGTSKTCNFRTGSYNLYTTSSVGTQTYTVLFSSSLVNSNYTVIVDSDCRVYTIDHGNPCKVINQTTSSFQLYFTEPAVVGGTALMTQGSVMVLQYP